VRLVREETSESCRLVVHGPDTEIAIYAFSNLAECIKRQAEIEGSLQAAGYQLDTTCSDRRWKRRIWRNGDHRRVPS
jgi:hypothetical protein